MTAVDRQQLEAAIGRNAPYYLRRFEAIDSGRKIGWNWAAFFLSTAWFSYRGMGNWAALNLAAPWLGMLLLAFTVPFSAFLGVAILVAYPVAFFIVVPMYADALYYERVKRAIAHAAGGGKPPPPTRPVSATIVGLGSVLLPALVLMIFQASRVDYTPRAQVGEAIGLMGGARTPVAEYFADKGRWPDTMKQVAESTSGRYTERIEITSGAGAASGAVVMTATMRVEGVRAEVAGRTVQMRSEDGGKTWTCTRGAVNGVDNKHLPAACR